MKRVLLGVAACLLMSLGATAQAALCSDPTSVLRTTDVSFGGVAAVDCHGLVSGQPTASNLGFDARTGFSDFSLLAGGLAPGATDTAQFLGIDFTIGITQRAGDNGSWSLAWSGTGLPATLDIVAVIQNSLGSWGSYLLSDLLFSGQGSGTGLWEISFIDPVLEQAPDLTAFSLYARGPQTTPAPTPTPTPVAEPNGPATVALAMLMLGFALRRARRLPRSGA